MAARTAGRRLPALSAAAEACSTAWGSAAGTPRSRTRDLVPARPRACATAAARSSPSTSRSIRPSASACALGTRAPLQASSMALGTPTRRGRRCVPPAPGMMPSVTSGGPPTVPAAAPRASQPSASSKPPPSAAPCSAATTGLAQASIAAMTSGSCGACSGWPNSRRSEPAMKVLPAPISTAALKASSRPTASMASSRPRRTSAEPALTGGLSITMTATSPSRSRCTRALMSLLRCSRCPGH